MSKIPGWLATSWACALLLAACGGGGNTPASPPVATTPPAIPPVMPPTSPTQPDPAPVALAVKATSYENFKAVGLAPQTLPADFGGANARAYADFSGRGVLDLFTATNTYDPQSSTPATASASRFAFWRKGADGSYAPDATLLDSSEGCIHPRKAIVADFNGDGRPDIFVACHGYDAAPFPGEKNKVVLSQSNGRYTIRDASDEIGFLHAASAADLNGDGRIDVVAVNNFYPQSAIAFLNNGDGSCTRETSNRFSAAIASKPYFSVELVDVDEDGKPDLVLGGHEWNDNGAPGAATVVLRNPGDFDFRNVQPVVLPALAGEGVVLDFVLGGSGATRAIWVLRTSGGDGTFYQSRVVEKVLWPSLSASVVSSLRPGQWIPWIIPATVNGQQIIAADAAQSELLIPRGD